MSHARTFERSAMCTKVPHPTRWQAERALIAIVASAHAGDTTPRAVYLCHDCAAWHLTSQRPKGFALPPRQ